jgi:hypothetical protein
VSCVSLSNFVLAKSWLRPKVHEDIRSAPRRATFGAALEYSRL